MRWPFSLELGLDDIGIGSDIKRDRVQWTLFCMTFDEFFQFFNTLPPSKGHLSTDLNSCFSN